MKVIKLLLRSALVGAIGCAPLHAQMLPQPQVSLTMGTFDNWNADWDGVSNRTYFVQGSIDLKHWYFLSLNFGDGLQNCGGDVTGGSRFFVRLKYIDDPLITSQEEAEQADFDNDGLSNLDEVALAGTDPFKGDTDGDLMPDKWEYDNRLKTSVDDAAEDPDGDGLTNLEEFQAGTKPGYYDSDGDRLGDDFEIANPGFNPLVYNDPDHNSDSDGLSDLQEMSNGTLPNWPDSDLDGISDSVEIASGSNARDSASTPFAYSTYLGGATEPAMNPMGNLGVSFDSGGQYTLDVSLNDKVGINGNKFTTEQESWRVWIDNSRFIDTKPAYTLPSPFTPFATPPGSIILDGTKVHELRVQHLGLAGPANPIYSSDDPTPNFKHHFSVSSVGTEKFLLGANLREPKLWVNGISWDTQSDPTYDWKNARVVAIPIVRTGYSSSYTGNDATGPRFRKISLFGRPIPDSKPESESESDEASEESYVDAFDLSLHHDTSFASIPLAASDLRLEANASVKETTWSSRSGLRPNEEITSPFGISWSSNLCAYIETVETFGTSTTRPTSVNVVDESGRSQRFGTADNLATFFPWPSSLTDKKTYLNALTKSGNNLVLTKKYGNKLTYHPCDAWFMYSSDRLDASPTVVRHRYWRLAEVADRFGRKVAYDYGGSTCSLIPVEIRSVEQTDQRLLIGRSPNGRRVLWVKDAKDNLTQFHYNPTQTVSIPSTSLSYGYEELAWVAFPDNTREDYTYEVVPDPEPEVINNKTTYYLYANLKSIQRQGYAKRVFSYDFDDTKQWYDYYLGKTAIRVNLDSINPTIASLARNYVHKLNTVPDLAASYHTQYGLPRLVTGVSWPTENIQASFSKTEDTETIYGPEFSSINGTNVTDATGKKYTYIFGGTHGEIIDTDASLTGGTSSVSTQWLVYHSNMTLQYKDAADNVLGSEYFEFDPNSGLSLKKTVDFCGNQTIWDFGQERPASAHITLANNAAFLTRWADPTSKTDAQNRIEEYEYSDSYRILKKQTDVHGSVTEYTVDEYGRRTDMTVKNAAGTILQKETYQYTDPDFPGFMTRKTRKVHSNLSEKTWVQDLVVEYESDSHGRVWREIVDPNQNNPLGKNLVTVHTYDLNNQKKTTLDPRNIETTFEYDARNRLETVTYASNSATSSVKSYGYDANNAKIRETDENNHSTLIERDGLGRVKKSARDMNGNNEINSGTDLITQFTYDKVGQVVAEIDPLGNATVTLRDDLHRPAHVFGGVPEASAGANLASLTSLASSSREITHSEFAYEIAKNTGGGLLNPFKPTSTTRNNAVSMTRGQPDTTLGDTAEYDDVYRPVVTKSEYNPNQFRTTQFDYGTVNAEGREPLVTKVTDSLGKVTKTTHDALGREVETIDGFGNTDPDLVLTTGKFYTSTGLLWRSVDSMGRHTETEYDGVGRPVKVYQPDPATATGEVTTNSPVTETEYDGNGNVSAVIDPLNRRTDFDYDLRNRKWHIYQPAVTNAANPDSPVPNVHPTTTFQYDDAGNESAVTDARGSTTRKFYDKANRLTKVRTNPQSGNPSSDRDAPGTHDITVLTNYDERGLVLSVGDGNDNFTCNAYDGLGRLIATATDPSDGDPPSLQGGSFDPATYRNANPTCALVSYLHDDAGNIIEVTDGEKHTTAFTFDGFNRKTSTIWDPGKTKEHTESFEFDALVQTSRVDGENHRTNYEYDDLHRLEDVVYRTNSSGTNHPDNRHITYYKNGLVHTVTYQNDPGSIRNVTSNYDLLDRLTSEISAGVTHTYPEYDKAGNRKQTTYGRTGTTLVCTYDALNRLETCEERSNATTPSGRTTIYAYDLGGKVTRKTLPNDNATTTAYDKIGRTLFMIERTSSLAVVSSFDYSQSVGSWPYSHDGVGNVLRCAENHTMTNVPDRVVVNTYDHNNRLDTETITPTGGSAVTTDYGYDLADNRVTKTVGSSVTAYQFGNGNNGANSNQLISYGPSGQAFTYAFSYDNNGNRTYRFGNTLTDIYGWDDENRLTSIEVEGATSILPPGGEESLVPPEEGSVYSYIYDHRGRRIVRNESAAGGALTELTFSGGTSVQEANSTGTVQTELIRGSDWGGGVGGVLFTIRSGQRSYNAYNSRGDVVSTSSDTGTATWQAAYEAFGTRTAEDGVNDERQRANTKDEDPTGLLNEGHRYRDLDAGVFISRDPAGFVDGPNVYAYVVQNPWTRFDPEGLSFLDMIDVIKDEGLGGTLRTMRNSAYNDFFGEVENAATQGAYLASQTGSTSDGLGYAAFTMIGGKDLMEADKGRELTFAADGDVSTRQLSGEEMKAKAISGTFKLAATTVSAVTGGISTTRTTVGLTEKVVANLAKKEVEQAAVQTLSSGGQGLTFEYKFPAAKPTGGRTGDQARLRQLADDDKVSAADRGWIKQEMTSIERGQRTRIRRPPGRELAHERGREAAKGYGYQHSNLQDKDLHRLQHKYDDFGRKNKERPVTNEE